MKKIYKKTLAIVLSALLILGLSTYFIFFGPTKDSFMLSKKPFDESTKSDSYTSNTLGRQNWQRNMLDYRAIVNEDILYYCASLLGPVGTSIMTYNLNTEEQVVAGGSLYMFGNGYSFSCLDTVGHKVYASQYGGLSNPQYLLELTQPDTFEPLYLSEMGSTQMNIIGDYVYYLVPESGILATHLTTRETTTIVPATDTFTIESFFYDPFYLYFQNANENELNRVYRYSLENPDQMEEFVLGQTKGNHYKLKFVHDGMLYFDGSGWNEETLGSSLISRAHWNGTLNHIFIDDSAGKYQPFRNGFLKTRHDFEKKVQWIAFYDSDGNYVKDLTKRNFYMDSRNKVVSTYDFVSLGNSAILFLNEESVFTEMIFIDENGDTHDITVDLDNLSLSSKYTLP